MENFVKTKQCAIIRLLSQMLCPMILGTTRNNKCKDSKASSYFALNSLKNFVKTLQYLLNWGPKMFTQFKEAQQETTNAKTGNLLFCASYTAIEQVLHRFHKNFQ